MIAKLQKSYNVAAVCCQVGALLDQSAPRRPAPPQPPAAAENGAAAAETAEATAAPAAAAAAPATNGAIANGALPNGDASAAANDDMEHDDGALCNTLRCCALLHSDREFLACEA